MGFNSGFKGLTLMKNHIEFPWALKRKLIKGIFQAGVIIAYELRSNMMDA